MSIETWLAFFVACWIISLSPGAGAIASMSSGLNYGFARGYWTALGLQLGLVVQIAVVAAGVGAVLAASALAFTLIKWFGVLAPESNSDCCRGLAAVSPCRGELHV